MKFTVTIDGAEKEVMVVKPGLEQQRQAQQVFNRAFKDAITSGALLRNKLEDFMKEQGLWDSKKQEELNKLQLRAAELEKTLVSGGIKLEQAKHNALEIKKIRAEINALASTRMELDSHTAEGQANNARFNYLVSACLVYTDKKPVFKDMEDYLQNADKDYAVTGASKFAELVYGLSENYEAQYEENKFLKEFGFCDDKFRLVNKDGHLVDEEGRLINEKGWFVDSEGNRVDINGQPLDEEGNYKVERKPFLDEDGNEL